MEKLQNLNNEWSSSQGQIIMDDIEEFRKLVNISEDSDIDDINCKFASKFDEMYSLREELSKNSLIGECENKEEQLLMDQNEVIWNRIMETIHYARNSIIALYFTSQASKHTHSYNEGNKDHSLYKFQSLNCGDMKPNQQMIFYLLQRFSEFNYRRYKDSVYMPIRTKEGYNTLAWKKVDTIENVIYKLFNKSHNLNMFLLLTKTKDGARSLINHFEKADDAQFIDLIKDRHVFSFRNGVYVTKVWDKNTNWWTDKFYDYLDSGFPSHLTSCKYFDVDFKYGDITDPNEIKTPLLDSIFKYQDLNEDVIMWNKVFLGRLLYEVEELDNWQTIMFYLGQGGTGKSTINNYVAKQFFDDQDVGIMSNNIQTKFGLSDIYEKFLFIAPEVKRDWCIEQAEFQEIVSGGTLNINVKHKQSEVVKWITPGVMGGNENPDFIDNSGSVKRRIIVTRFDKKVTKGDTQLGRKIQKELPAIIKQCNMFYQQFAKDLCRDDGSDIWSHLPSYFIETQEIMNEATSSLANFMNSGKLKFGIDEYVPSDIFIHKFNSHAVDNGFKKPKWVPDFYLSHFNANNIKVKKNITKVYKGQTFKRHTFFIGVDINDNASDDDVDDEREDNDPLECNKN